VSLPLFVGGGIRTPDQVAAARRGGADFVVVGNAIEDAGAGAVCELVRAMRNGVV